MTLPDFPELKMVAAVLVGGGIGSVTRFLAGHYLAAIVGTTFPWATLFINVSGSMWLGFIATLALQKPGVIDPTVRLLLTTGFAGGFTTFSTYAYESLVLYQKGDVMLAAANLSSNVVIGMLFVWLGAVIARVI